MKVSRRDLLTGAAGVVALGKTAAAQTPQPPPTRPRCAASRAGRSASARRPRSRSASRAASTSSGTPHQDLYGTITPADLHFERHHGGVPEIDPKSVLAADPRDGRAADGVHARRSQALSRRQPRPLPRVLRKFRRPRRRRRDHAAAARRPDQHQRVDRRRRWPRSSAKSAPARRRRGSSPKDRTRRVLTRSIPVAKAYDDALIAYGQNGEAIRPEQGYPARLFLPGLGRQRQREVAAAHRAVGSSVHDARGNVEVHRSDGRRHGAHLQLPDGRALADHLSRVPGDAHAAAGSRSTASRGPDPERSRASTSAPTAARRGRRRNCRSRCCRKRTRGSGICGTGPAATR